MGRWLARSTGVQARRGAAPLPQCSGLHAGHRGLPAAWRGLRWEMQPPRARPPAEPRSGSGSARRPRHGPLAARLRQALRREPTATAMAMAMATAMARAMATATATASATAVVMAMAWAPRCPPSRRRPARCPARRLRPRQHLLRPLGRRQLLLRAQGRAQGQAPARVRRGPRVRLWRRARAPLMLRAGEPAHRQAGGARAGRPRHPGLGAWRRHLPCRLDHPPCRRGRPACHPSARCQGRSRHHDPHPRRPVRAPVRPGSPAASPQAGRPAPPARTGAAAPPWRDRGCAARVAWHPPCRRTAGG
jgi:hypothetical protein